MRGRQTSTTIIAAAAAVFVITFIETEPHGAAKDAVVQLSTYYSGCNEARAAGAAPLYRGQAGYRKEMDGDGDGIACEPYRRSW